MATGSEVNLQSRRSRLRDLRSLQDRGEFDIISLSFQYSFGLVTSSASRQRLVTLEMSSEAAADIFVPAVDRMHTQIHWISFWAGLQAAAAAALVRLPLLV